MHSQMFTEAISSSLTGNTKCAKGYSKTAKLDRPKELTSLHDQSQLDACKPPSLLELPATGRGLQHRVAGVWSKAHREPS